MFEEEAKKIGAVDFLVQGTIYPDVIESGLGTSAVIKSHHNVGGLPDHVDFKEIIEPLRHSYLRMKYEKRVWSLVYLSIWYTRQPFPGPGLGIRIIGAVTRGKSENCAGSGCHLPRGDCKSQDSTASIGQYFAAL